MPSPVPPNAHETVRAVAHMVMGTEIEMNTPLMSAGLDSLAATALTSGLAVRLSVDVTATALFDHPTLDSIAVFLSNELDCHTASQSTPREVRRAEPAQIPSMSRGR